MLFLEGEAHGKPLRLLILETGNLEELKKGRPLVSPDKQIIIAWTPDPVWLTEQITAADGDTEKIVDLIEEATKRPQAPDRPYHGPKEVRFTKEGT